jgi:SPX domain protein involved in polyphosphate accumulation
MPFSTLLLLLLLLQGFVRSTTKYWVRAEDVSNVKYHVLQHLPVFQFDKSDFSGDAQLINSVYFDNENLELYHGRLDKKPNAIALRIRWGKFECWC